MGTIHREPLRMIVFATCLLPYVDKDLPPLKLEELDQMERENAKLA